LLGNAEKVDTSNLIEVLDSVNREIEMNVNDTFSRFITTPEYAELSEGMELKNMVGETFK